MKNFSSLIIYFLYAKWSKTLGTIRTKPVLSFLRIAASVLIFVFIAGCYYYKVNTTIDPSSGTITSIQPEGKTIVIHSNSAAFILDNIVIGKDSIKGHYAGDYEFAFRSYSFPINNSSHRYWKHAGKKQIYNEIHFYLRDITSTPKYDVLYAFAFTDVSRLDIYNKDQGATAVSWFFGVIGGLIGAWVAFIAILLLVAIIGGSCPYIYVNTGHGFDFAGEIYSGAIYAPLERNDYLVLPRLVAENGKYLLKMSNEQSEEVQHTNLMELFVFDHPVNSQVLVDKYGNYQTSTDMQTPLNATNLTGTDILGFVGTKDSISYCGMPAGNEIPLTDGVIMTFNLPQNIDSGKLFVRARNSVWLDNVFKEFFGLLGGYQDAWIKRNNNANPQRLQAWSLDQKIPLSVYVEKNGKWEFCDYFNLAGPMALKEDVLAIDLKGIDANTLKIKLESGFNFWEIDFAGIDFSTNVPVNLSKVIVDQAVTEDGEQIQHLLEKDDSDYYVQSETDNLADLSFSAPAFTGQEKTVILHSKGYYQMNLKSKGLPHLAKLNKIRQPGNFPEYSRELLKSAFDDLYDKGIMGFYTESGRNE
jgi:hypothetical protein